ncbi:MAG: ArsR/SmtB family transcription factor [Pyramidobacter sp.]|jgi:DNA-binding transcriptional ArsR family regulator
MKKDELRRCVDVFKAIAHPVRLQIVDLLADGERCACEISAQFPDLDRTTVSKHLALMVQKGVLTAEKRGVNVIYALRLTCLSSALRCVLRSEVCADTAGCCCKK